MRRGSSRARVYALIWAALQLALPASAALLDARLAAASSPAPHVEEGPGGDCVPVHSTDCVVCKQLSTLSLASAARFESLAGGASDCARPARAGVLPGAQSAVSLARGPPR